MKVKNENYLVIQGWMVNELGLKGNELVLYALIYGFSQDGEQGFRGSIQYLMDWTNSSRKTVYNLLKSLEEKNLIRKIEATLEGGNKVCTYVADTKGDSKQCVKITQGREKITQPCVKITHDMCKNYTNDVKKLHTDNYIYNNNNIYNNTSAKSDGKEIAKIPLKDGTEYIVTADDVHEWTTLYPSVDIEQELMNMRGWSLGNPDRRKTKRGVKRFIMGWLAREQAKPKEQKKGPNFTPRQQQNLDAITLASIRRINGGK